MTSATVTLPTTLQMLLGLCGYLLPVLLYVTWSTLALWDLGRRAELSRGGRWIWTFVIFLIPFAGPVAYLLFAGAQISARTKQVMIFGGATVYARASDRPVPPEVSADAPRPSRVASLRLSRRRRRVAGRTRLALSKRVAARTELAGPMPAQLTYRESRRKAWPASPILPGDTSAPSPSASPSPISQRTS